jgi:hypothetical protein
MFQAPKFSYNKRVPVAHRKSSRYEDDRYRMYTYNGTLTFAYRGIAIEKRKAMYTIAKRIQISGFPAESLMRLAGSYNNGADLRGEIDYALTFCNPERVEQVRNRHRNCQCPMCETVSMFKVGQKQIIYRTIRDTNGEEIEIDTGKRNYRCEWCDYRYPLEDVEYVSDEIMR